MKVFTNEVLESVSGQSFEGMGIRRRIPSKAKAKRVIRDIEKRKAAKVPGKIPAKTSKGGIDSYTQEILDEKTDIPVITMTDAGVNHFIHQAKLVYAGKKSSLKGGSEDVGDALNHLSIRLKHGKGKLSVASCKKILELWNEAFEKEGSSSMQDVLGAGLPRFIEYYLKSLSGSARAAAFKTLFIENTHLLTNAYEEPSIKKMITDDLFNAALEKAISKPSKVSGTWNVIKLLLLGTYGGLRYKDISTKKSFVKISLPNISKVTTIPLKDGFSHSSLLVDLFDSAVKNHGASKAIGAFSVGLAQNKGVQEEFKDWVKQGMKNAIPTKDANILAKVTPANKPSKSFKAKSSDESEEALSQEEYTFLDQEHLDLEDEPQILMDTLSKNNSVVEYAVIVSGTEMESLSASLSASQKKKIRFIRTKVKQRNSQGSELETLVIKMLSKAKTMSDLSGIASFLDARTVVKTVHWYYGLSGRPLVRTAFTKAAMSLSKTRAPK